MSNLAIKVGSFNIRYAENNKKDVGDRHWNVRKRYVVERLIELNLDVFGTQEGSLGQNEYLKGELKEFDYYGVGREDGISQGEFCAIFFRRERFQPIKSETFWLSLTPEKPSKDFGSSLKRICSYVILKSKENGREFLVANAHLDHIFGVARENQMKVLIKKLEKWKYPKIIMGDFNCGFNSKPYNLLKSAGFIDSYLAKSLKLKNDNDLLTFHDFSQRSKKFISRNGKFRIDWIFVSAEINVLDAGIRIDREKENIASDHFPIFALLEL